MMWNHKRNTLATVSVVAKQNLHRYLVQDLWKEIYQLFLQSVQDIFWKLKDCAYFYPLSDLFSPLFLYLSSGNQWNSGRWDGTGEDSAEYCTFGSPSRGERALQAKGLHLPHSSQKLRNIWLSLLLLCPCAPASFKESWVSGWAFCRCWNISLNETNELYHCFEKGIRSPNSTGR